MNLRALFAQHSAKPLRGGLLRSRTVLGEQRLRISHFRLKIKIAQDCAPGQLPVFLLRSPEEKK